MMPADLKKTLDRLLSLTAENEVVEFKEAKNNYDFGKAYKSNYGRGFIIHSN